MPVSEYLNIKAVLIAKFSSLPE